MEAALARRIREAADSYKDYMVALRRDIHAHPEPGFQEFRTCQLLAGEFAKLGLPVRSGLAHTGVVALLRGARPGKTVALRADIDALPFTEQTGLPFASQTPGVAHLCGHDAHAAMLLGAAHVLYGLRDELAGKVKFFCEPSEEGPNAEGVFGAQLMVADGAMDDPKVDAVFACHVFPEYPTGTVALRAGSIMAGHARFALAVVGKEAHAATPQLGVDAMLVAGQVLNALHAYAARAVPPGGTFALNVGTIRGGAAYNLIAGRVDMVGSVRSDDEALRAGLGEVLERLVCGITQAAGATYEFSYQPDTYPATSNDPALTALVRRTAAELLGEDKVIWMDRPRLTGETFCYYLERTPGVYFILGTGNAAKGTTYSSHHPCFDIDEDALPAGAAMLAASAIAYLREQAT